MTDQENKALYIAQECRKAGMTGRITMITRDELEEFLEDLI